GLRGKQLDGQDRQGSLLREPGWLPDAREEGPGAAGPAVFHAVAEVAVSGRSTNGGRTSCVLPSGGWAEVPPWCRSALRFLGVWGWPFRIWPRPMRCVQPRA